ncbi:MAG: hypothetical protein AB1649_18605 [Chloroflexota bacterium]
MILLDNRVSDLARGYDRISQADLRLQTEWRQHLLRNYASRRDQHASALGEYVGKARVLKPQLSIIAFVPLAMLIGGLVITVIGILAYAFGGAELTLGIGGLALVFAGAIGFGLPTLLWFWQVRLAKPAAPAHPLHEDLLTRLTPQWRAKLHGSLPMAILLWLSKLIRGGKARAAGSSSPAHYRPSEVISSGTESTLEASRDCMVNGKLSALDRRS